MILQPSPPAASCVLEPLLSFLAEIDRLKKVERQVLIHSGGRRENSAEHSWHLAMAVLLFSGHAVAPIDPLKAVKMALIHDLVEIEAGDTFLYGDQTDKLERERQALIKLTRELPSVLANEFRDLFEEYESATSAEAKYVLALDRFLPVFSNCLNDGHSWKNHSVAFEQVVARNQSAISEGVRDLWPLTENRIRATAVASGCFEPAVAARAPDPSFAWRLKQSPEDFVVQECPRHLQAAHELGDATQTYVWLCKKGFTTLDAIDRIAEILGIPSSAITHSGLKDEDGITRQLIAIGKRLTGEELRGLNRALAESAKQGACVAAPELSVGFYGYGKEGFVPGGLLGNFFSLKVRGVDRNSVEALRDRGTIELPFINYYDQQRFALPGERPTAHLIGGHLRQGAFAEAFELVKTTSGTNGKKAMGFKGSADEFFRELDPRRKGFYLSAHSSSLWNKQVASTARLLARDQGVFEFETGGQKLVVPTSRRLVTSLYRELPAFHYSRYVPDPQGGLEEIRVDRPTVQHTRVEIATAHQDWAELSFFLPSGCYATMAVRGLCYLLRSDQR